MLGSQYGFHPSPRKPGDINFTGVICVVDLDVRVELRFLSEFLLEPPKAFLLDWNYDIKLRKFLGTGHISSNGLICYYDESREFWNASQLLAYTAGAIERIREILESDARGDNSEEWIRDFNGYWPNNPPLYLCERPTNKSLFDELSYDAKTWLVHRDSHPEWLKRGALKATQWHSIELCAPPVPAAEDWPPTKIHSLINWMVSFVANPAMLLAVTLCSLHPNRKKRAKQSECKGIIFYWGQEAPQFFGIRFTMSSSQKNALCQGRKKGLANLLSYSGVGIDFEPVNFERIDLKYIHQRSLPEGGQTLENKRILLVGAGAIGGYLAQQLAALGAGWGKNGILTIVDNDFLSSANIGRHLLGLKMLGCKKVDALRNYLYASFPHLNIIAIGESIFDSVHLFSPRPDMVINATGSETVSIALEVLLRMKFDDRPPIVHGWVLGHGLAVQAYIRESETDACFECLWDGTGPDRRRRSELSKDPSGDTTVFAPCHHSFYPFTVNAAASAASLMTTVIVDWLQGGITHTLRHIILRPEKCFKRPDSRPMRKKGCTVCSRYER